MKKRIISILITIVMIVGMVQFGVFSASAAKKSKNVIIRTDSVVTLTSDYGIPEMESKKDVLPVGSECAWPFPSAPSRKGFAFLGWYSSSERGASMYTAYDMITFNENKTAYGQWFSQNPNDENVPTENRISRENCEMTVWGENGKSTYYVVTESCTIPNRVKVNGTVYLILSDGYELTMPKGIELHEGNTLILCGSNDPKAAGKLIVKADSHSAAIGTECAPKTESRIFPPESAFPCGNLYMLGGSLKAFASGGGAAIGGGCGCEDRQGGNGGNHWFYGGSLYAYGSARAIGGGNSESEEGAYVKNGSSGTTIFDPSLYAFTGNDEKSLNRTTESIINANCVLISPTEDASTVQSLLHFGEWTVTKEATCTENGVQSLICKSCGEILRKNIIPASGHSFDANGKCTICGYENEPLSPSSGSELGRRATLPGGKPVIKVTELPRVDKQGYSNNGTRSDSLKTDDVNYEKKTQNRNSENNNVVEAQTQASTQNSNSADKNVVEASADTESTTNSSLSGGTVWIIVGVAAAVIIAAVLYAVLRMKKKQ